MKAARTLEEMALLLEAASCQKVALHYSHLASSRGALRSGFRRQSWACLFEAHLAMDEARSLLSGADRARREEAPGR
jgi:hypothetical protein